MKKCLSFMLILTIALTPLFALAQAQPTFADCVSLPELSAQALEGWHKTYTAHGREVVANVDIRRMPQADTCPIVEIEEQDVDPALLEKFQGKDNRAEASTKWHSVEIAVDSKRKSWYLKGYSGMYAGKLDRDERYLADGEIPTDKPEGLDCTYKQLMETLNGHLKLLIGRSVDDYQLNPVSMGGVNWTAKKKDGRIVRGKPITVSGSWHVNGWLKVHGIPLQCAWEGPYGYMTFNYYGENCYTFIAHPIREKKLVADDVPLLSFAAFKAVLEKQIDAGMLRGVDEMQFCYLPFLQKDAEGSHWILQPVWRVLCGYTKDPSKEQVMPYYAKRDTDGSLTVPEEYGDAFYNAQTGEMIQVEYTQPHPAYEMLTWEDVR
ncbi:MAG: hypothetical protein RR521_10115 [Clostridia bacterium]